MDTTYTVSNQSDRMGYRLSGPTLPVPDQSMLSAATVMGAIQIPASGQPIVLMADRQTTGGYPFSRDHQRRLADLHPAGPGANRSV